MTNTDVQKWREEFDKKTRHYVDGLGEFCDEPDGEKVKGFWLRSGMDGDVDWNKVKDFIDQLLQESIREKEEEFKKYRPVLQDMNATDWLRNVYGLDDNDTLNAGQVEELLQQFIYDHAKYAPHRDTEDKGESNG